MNQQNELRYMGRVEVRLNSPCFLTLLFLFLSPPKNFPIWSRRLGFFFLRPSPKAACAELLADAMLVLVVGSIFVKCGAPVTLSIERPKNRWGQREKAGREGDKKLAYSRSSSGLSNPHSEAAPLCSWMVCNSSDSEGRSLKVLSSRPGASREKRRTRWGRGVAASGSAVLAEVQSWWGPSAPLESVTAGFCEMQPLFWFASASPGPAQKQQGSSMGLGLHGTQLTRAAQRVLLTRTCPSLLQRPAQLTFYIWTCAHLTCITGS